MATKPEIVEVLVPVDDPEESVIIDALNFKGQACSIATKGFEKALGKVENKSMKPEFYKEEKVKRNIKLGK